MANTSANPISFIDCMCNAGVYQDGELGTSMEVLQLFIKFAKQYPNKYFNIFLNDFDSDRISIITQLISVIMPIKPRNLSIYTSCSDVNDYLTNFKSYLSYGTILFVDPYDFGTVRLESIKTFTNIYYCELLWNVFTSDFIRNINNDLNNVRLINCLGTEIKSCKTTEDVIDYIRKCLISGNIKYSFSYSFKILTNRELYQIMFFTPKILGLEKLKDALWEVFSGKEFHRNHFDDPNQLCLLTDETDKDMCLNEYKSKAQKMLMDYLKQNNKKLTFNELETFILENSMLQKGHILKHVIKPLINAGVLIKLDLNGKKNYTNDSYTLKGEVVWKE